MSRGREGAARGGDGGGRVALYSISPSPEDVDLGGGGLPPHAFSPPDQQRADLSLSLLTRPRALTRGVSRLPPSSIHGWIGIPQLATVASKTLRKIVSTVKR
jgi:hypothetical protein